MRLLWSCALLVSVFSALPTEGSGESNTTCPCSLINKGDADKNEYPFIVSVLAYKKKQLCKGTIITTNHILTASSCVHNWDEIDLSVAVGKTALKGPFEEIYKVKWRYMPDDYLTGDILNDISVLLINKKIEFNENVGPACLPPSRINLEGQTITALDYSKTVDLRVISFKDCYKTWRKYIRGALDNQPSEDTSMCTLEKNEEICAGDAGTPLVWLDPDTNRYTLVAMAPIGRACGGEKAVPHTDVGAWIPWIIEQISVSKPEAHICHKM